MTIASRFPVDYRRNAAAVCRLIEDLRSNDERRARAIKALILHHLDDGEGLLVCAAILLRAGVDLAEEPMVEALALGFSPMDQFACMAFLLKLAGRAPSIAAVHDRYRRGTSRQSAILTLLEMQLEAGRNVRAERWPRPTAAPARAAIENIAKLVQVFGAPKIIARSRKIVAEVDRSHLRNARQVVLSPNFFYAIGHMVIARAVADLLKAQHGARLVLSTVKSKTATPWLASALTTDINFGALPEDAPILNAMADSLIPVDGGLEGGPATDAAWSMTKVASWAATRWIETPAIAGDVVDAVTAQARGRLVPLGWDPDRFLVTLHVRDSGYRGASYSDGQRNADIAAYDAAIDLIVAAGGTVVRLGDPAMTRMRPRPHVIDYAHCDVKSDWMDVALAALCRFHIGTASGMSFVPLLFGKPVLFTNWITLAHVVSTPNTLYLPKPLMRVGGGRVSLEEQGARYPWAIQTEHIEQHGLYFQDNTADEILDAVDFLMTHLDEASGRMQLPADLAAEQCRRFNAVGVDPAPFMPPRALAAWIAASSGGVEKN